MLKVDKCEFTSLQPKIYMICFAVIKKIIHVEISVT